MNKQLAKQRLFTLSTAALVMMITGCTLNNYSTADYTEMQSIALCQVSEKATLTEGKITAEYGFRRFAKNTYRPVLEYRLFGHEVRVIELNPQQNKLYVAGNLPELAHHVKTLLPEIVCEANNCQAPINDLQTLYIYKPKNKKSKNTVVIECTKPEPAAE